MPSLPWLAPLAFAIIILLGLMIGYWNGWKTAIYFFIWSTVALIISIIVFVSAYDELADQTPNINIGDVNLKDLVIANKENIKPLMGVIYSLSIVLVANLVALILYWTIFPLRRFLKRSIKENKKMGNSNSGTRFIGSGIGTITAIPIAALSAGSLVVLSNEKTSFTEINSKLVNGISFGQYTDSDSSVEEIRAFIEIAGDDDLKNTISAIFGGKANKPLEDLSPSQRKTLETALNSKIATSTISNKDVIKGLIGEDKIKEIDFTKLATPLSPSQIPVIKPENRDAIVDAVLKGIVPQSAKNASEAQVRTYLTTLLGW